MTELICSTHGQPQDSHLVLDVVSIVHLIGCLEGHP